MREAAPCAARTTDMVEIREAHYPGRAPVDAYGNGGFRFAEMSHKGSILLLPSGVYAWDVADAATLAPADFARVFAEEAPPEVLLVGTGRSLVFASAAVRHAFRDNAIGLEMMDTGAAARTYNVLLAEDRSVGAALVAVE